MIGVGRISWKIDLYNLVVGLNRYDGEGDGNMIKDLISKYIREKQEVRVYCQMGTAQFSYVSGVITAYGAENDSIRLVSTGGGQQVSLIPLASVHSITSI